MKPPPSAPSEGPWWSTAISALEPQLLYRGYPVDELVKQSFLLETAYLLVNGDLPTEEQLTDWQALMHEAMSLPAATVSWLKRLVLEHDLTALLLAAISEKVISAGGRSSLRVSDQYPYWLGRLTAVVAAGYRMKRGLPPLEPRPELFHAANVWWLLTETNPSEGIVRSLEALFILCAEHGFSPATVSVRMASATGGELSAALVAGIAVAQGSRAAGAAAEALAVLDAVRSPDRAAGWVAATLKRQGFVPGFRHRVYRTGDPRTEVLTPICRFVAEQTHRQHREQLARAIETAVWDQMQMLPALSWPVGRLLDNLGIEQELFVPLYVLSRLAGWTAHYQEQMQLQERTVFRSHYVGEALRHVHRMHEPME